MKIKVYKNEYGYERAKCPFCQEDAYTRGKVGNDKFKCLIRHLINQAKNEALNVHLNSKTETHHLTYVKGHFKFVTPTLVLSKYQFDNEFTV